jgi:uncharacterized protein (DUF302 family)
MKTFISAISADESIAKLLEGVDAANMRVVAHINGQANAAKIGKEVPADQILEIFRPDFAIRVWSACKAAGYDIPLRIHVYDEDGKTHVACRLPSEVFAPYASQPLMEVAQELDTIFNTILGFVPEV